jgi:hypothetical protein
MAHTFDTKAQISGATNPVTGNYTCGVGTTLLVLGIVAGGGTARAGGTPTYNGVAMTEVYSGIKAVSSPETVVDMYYMLAPPTGSSLQISIPNTGTLSLWCCASSYKAQTGYTSAYDTKHSATGTSTNPTDDVTTTVAGDAIVQVLGDGRNAVPTANSDVLLYKTLHSTYSDDHQYKLPSDYGLNTVSWSCLSDDWAIITGAWKEVIIATQKSLSVAMSNVLSRILKTSKRPSVTMSNVLTRVRKISKFPSKQMINNVVLNKGRFKIISVTMTNLLTLIKHFVFSKILSVILTSVLNIKRKISKFPSIVLISVLSTRRKISKNLVITMTNVLSKIRKISKACSVVMINILTILKKRTWIKILSVTSQNLIVMKKTAKKILLLVSTYVISFTHAKIWLKGLSVTIQNILSLAKQVISGVISKSLSIVSTNILSIQKGIRKIISVVMINIPSLAKNIISSIIHKLLIVTSVNILSLRRNIKKTISVITVMVLSFIARSTAVIYKGFTVSIVNIVYTNKKLFIELNVIMVNVLSIVAKFVERVLSKKGTILRMTKKDTELLENKAVLKKDNIQEISNKDKTVKLIEKRGEMQ